MRLDVLDEAERVAATSRHHTMLASNTVTVAIIHFTSNLFSRLLNKA